MCNFFYNIFLSGPFEQNSVRRLRPKPHRKGSVGARFIIPMDFGLEGLGYLAAVIGKTGRDNSQISFWYGIIIRTDGASNAEFVCSGD